MWKECRKYEKQSHYHQPRIWQRRTHHRQQQSKAHTEHHLTELAEKGPCVIVGRCADYILREKADCLKVFIHADMKFRAERIVKVYGERERSPEERLRDKDKRRAAYHRFYTNMKWGHAQNFT